MSGSSAIALALALALTSLVTACGRPSATAESSAPTDSPTVDTIRPLVTQYCVGCHSGAHASGKLHLDTEPFSSDTRTSLHDIAHEMAARLSNAQRPMPPRLPNLPQPNPDQLKTLQDWADQTAQTTH